MAGGWRRFRPGMLLSSGVLVIFLCGLAALENRGVAPRELARRVERSPDSPLLLRASADFVAGALRSQDGYRPTALAGLPNWAGAQAERTPSEAAATRTVHTVPELLEAVTHAQAGDIIELAAGEYRIAQARIAVEAAGQRELPIVLRAPRLGDVRLLLQSQEGFLVRAPFWRFENLDIQGACERADDCDHAFHIVGAAHSVQLVNNRITDFNAHIKINGERGVFPERGSIEFNTLRNATPRRTANPVAPIDLVAASGWTVRGNLIADFIKAGGDRLSYGAFAKGGGSGNRFEANVIVCEAMLVGYGGQRVGLSFGGGGTAPDFCRDKRCVVEQQSSSMRNNLVTRCSDRGIYLNSAADSSLSHNTLIDTAGITVRHAESSARIEANLIDGDVSARDGAIVHENDNGLTEVVASYFGWHPVKRLFQAPEQFDFAWRGEAPRRTAGDSRMLGETGDVAEQAIDLCPLAAPDPSVRGAFARFEACTRSGGDSR